MVPPGVELPRPTLLGAVEGMGVEITEGAASVVVGWATGAAGVVVGITAGAGAGVLPLEVYTLRLLMVQYAASKAEGLFCT